MLAIEEDRFGDLAARTYAVGFARAYARAVDLDEAEIAAAVRRQTEAERKPVERTPSFEPGDPARVPPRRLAWLAGGAAVTVVVVLALFWGNFLSPAGTLPDLVAEEVPLPAASASSPTPEVARPAPGGPVVLTAMDDGVWVSVRDADGARLLERQLTIGESWMVPSDARGPQLRTGRPDALRLTVGGKTIPPLADRPTTISGVSLASSDLLARAQPGAGASDPAASVLPAASTPVRRPAPTRRFTSPVDEPAPAAMPGGVATSDPAGTAPAAALPAPARPTSSAPAPAQAPASARPEGAVSTETG